MLCFQFVALDQRAELQVLCDPAQHIYKAHHKKERGKVSSFAGAQCVRLMHRAFNFDLSHLTSGLGK